ncbi:MAG: tetratricopeptide (TPR) repeat protein [Arenicella sp.]|jgi:tetratricopeptide (TPR) repeat protein
MKIRLQHRAYRFTQKLIATLIVTLLISLTLNIVYAQSGMVIGGDSFAAECYRNSQVAISVGNANRHDLKPCDRAISDGTLRRDYLVASYVNRGAIHMAMADPKSALDDLNHALELDDKTGEAYVNRGNLWFLGNKFPNAVADYDLALKLGVEKPHVAHLNRGMAQEQMGKFEEAKADYQRSLNYAVGWTEAESRLARVIEKINKGNREKK